MAVRSPAESDRRLRPSAEVAGQLTLLDSPHLVFDAARDHGEVFTRRWVVEMILDSVGYTEAADLATRRLSEPSCGNGAFLVPIVERLSRSCKRHGRGLESASEAIQACDLLQRNADAARALVYKTLVDEGWNGEVALTTATCWVRHADYLLEPFEDDAFDFVVGNPPYIRPEELPDELNQLYRKTWTTMMGRADIYVGFLERGLRSLRKGGQLGFICADRWMRNQYGRALRSLIADQFAVKSIVVMHDVDAFEDSVSAYPAVMVFGRETQSDATIVETTSEFGASSSEEVLRFDAGSERGPITGVGYQAAKLPHWFGGDESWPTGSPARLSMIEYLTDNFPPLEDAATGTRVGIGVATGADGAYVVPGVIDVESDRLLPLSMVRDLATGSLTWSGHYLVNPWDENGLVNLADNPKLAAYYESCGDLLRGRHVAERYPATWHRTIDRVHASLTARTKLLMPDMRMTISPVLDPGGTYPHHNLYYVVSDTWDMEVLGGLLLSRVANAFVEAYCVKMRGGTLRFQAQYLRRIRVPRLSSITKRDAAGLAKAFRDRDVDWATEISLRLYGLPALVD